MAHGDRADFQQQGGGNMRAFGQTLDGVDVVLFVDGAGRLKVEREFMDLLLAVLAELKTANLYLAIMAGENLQEV